MNSFNLNDLENFEIHPDQIKDILEAILHTILFCRAFGPIKIQEIYLDFLDVTYLKCNDISIEEQVHQKVQTIYENWKKINFQPSKRTVVLGFDEIKNSRLFGYSTSKVRWEQWIIRISVQTNARSFDKESYLQLGTLLSNVLKKIACYVDENKEHVGSILTKETIPFPYEISFPDASSSSNGFFAALGNLFSSTVP